MFCKNAFLILLIVSTNLSGQEIKMVTKLPAVINESSGIETTARNRIWTFNDSGGKAELFLIDSLGNLLKTLKINDAWNRDWEAITKDVKENFYIGNIGNNSNSNKDLTLFKIPNPANIKGNSVSATIISFSFEDQTGFPPSTDSMNFDCESMFWYNQHIYLFTKHRSFPMATNLYRFPAVEGKHIAKKMDTFYTGKTIGEPKDFGDYWVTGAAISPDGTLMCLVNAIKLWLFYDYTEDNFFDGKFIEINLGKRTQKEAVCFATNNEIYITDEYWADKDIGGNLYKIKINSLILK